MPVENLRTAKVPSNPLRVLSHALPSPSPDGHIFSSIISAIHESTPSSPTVWINVFHAVPGRFNLADLPTSPPNTPGQPISGEDYFTQKVFDSAVPVSDYQEELSSLPRSLLPQHIISRFGDCFCSSLNSYFSYVFSFYFFNYVPMCLCG